MSWTERQRQMLAAMGLRLWLPQPTEAAAPTAPARPEAPAPHEAAPPSRGPAPAIEHPSPAPARPPVAAHVPPPPPAPLASAPGTPPEEAERAAALARMDWAELAQAAAGCQACGLCQTRKQVVFGVGARQAPWMVVGEAPGEQEDLQGEPFVGAAGQLLDQMLAAVRRSRHATDPAEAVYIANTLKCRPPRNRNPAPDELRQCAPLLTRQIELVRPKLILAMGRFAIQHLLGTDEAVGRLRGRVHQHAGVPVVVTYHPAYLLRQLPDKRKAWDDLCLALEVSGQAPG